MCAIFAVGGCMQSGIDKAVAAMGSQTALAKAINLTPQAISTWVKKGQIPLFRIKDVERVTGISKNDLLPNWFK